MHGLRRSGKTTEQRKKDVLGRKECSVGFFLSAWPVWFSYDNQRETKHIFLKMHSSKQYWIKSTLSLAKLQNKLFVSIWKKRSNSQSQYILTKSHFLIRLTCKLGHLFLMCQWAWMCLRACLSPRALGQLPLASGCFLLVTSTSVCPKVPIK